MSWSIIKMWKSNLSLYLSHCFLSLLSAFLGWCLLFSIITRTDWRGWCPHLSPKNLVNCSFAFLMLSGSYLTPCQRGRFWLTTFTFFRNEESCQQEPSPLTFFRKMPVNASADSPDLSVRPPSPIPSPSGGGCRPQGRQERENVTGPRCGNDRRGKATILPSASGHVLPLPSFALRQMPPSPAGHRR